MKLIFFPLFCTLFALISIGGLSTFAKPPSDWVRIDAHKFEFYVPPDIKTIPAQGIDSYVGEYKGDTISLGFDYGLYSDPLTGAGRTNIVILEEHVDGKDAKIVSFYNPGGGHPFNYAIGIHFPTADGPNVKLTVFASCKTTNEYETVKTIFRTIKFK